MPYVSREERLRLEVSLPGVPDYAGGLNYQLTLVVIEYLRYNGLSYGTCNDIVGALDNCKDEFRRRVQHPYENEKIKENGDIYE